MTDLAHRPARLSRWPALALAGLGVAAIAVAASPAVGGVALAAPKALWLVSALGVALVVAGLAAAAGRVRFGLLAGALVCGGAGQLWLTDPLWFPSLRLRPDGALDLVAGGLIALQAAVVLALLARFGVGRLARALGGFGWGRVLAILLVTVLLSVPPMGFALGGGHWMSWGLRLVVQTALILLDGLALALLLALPAPPLALRLPALPVAVALGFGGAAAFALWGFERLPHVEDEAVYLLQARLFLDGALSAPAPPEALWPGLEYYLLEMRDGRWIPTTAPGWPAILALGTALGAPWLVNPVLAALTVLVAAALARRLWGDEVAALTALLIAVSPWFLILGGSLMPHMAPLFLVLLTWLLLLRARDGGALWLALLAGLAMGWVFVIRQLEGVIVGLLTGLWLLSRVRQPGGFARGALYAVGCVATGSLYLVANRLLTGSALASPLQRYIDDTWGNGANGYGFGPAVGPPEGWGGLDLAPGHGIGEALLHTAQSLALIDMDLYGWGVGSLILVWIAIALGRLDRPVLALLGVSLAIAAALLFYWASGVFYTGARYWSLAIFPLAVLSAQGYLALRDRIGASAPAVLALLAIFSLGVYAPWQMVEKYRGFRGATPLVRDAGLEGDLVVFVDIADYGSALHLNDPFLRDGRPVYLRDLGPEANAAAAAALPGREVVYLAAPGGGE